ncbi:pyruvate kinase [Synechococcus sp. CS-602]|uniref:pyruvate kinase n=1 Tax=Synechococcaceae TaxID=1890426 RepID=UPI0008FF6E1A|nr:MULTISPECIES: pyruvate kinase [Synechococcaceae]MCT4364290.1 pyruvate kinase [Candidatus Regnicoccus frigidus MAG-AL1]APD49588.1 pyruvate kinase [Synechococcus sp. SynAce01]MCT0203738.1 pyruvate kinase [Synechococcus sp. CS-602]MCT0246427.1 pyruvate kinase [Synechococcus sp. CS-601]MCT4368809.1 pyruvate kinase [Candidatus Regnicoccus frigidus MAG-AL2]
MAQPDLSRRTKIVATIGPATESPERLRQLIHAGATTFRLNFSHGDHAEHALRIATIRQVAHELGIHVGILQDLQGPKIRLGRFIGGPITLANGVSFDLTSRDVACTQEIATVTYNKLSAEVMEGSRILLDDGRVEMVVDRVDKLQQTLHCTVVVGGVLSNNKGVNFPDVQLSIRALTDKDRHDLAFGLQQGVDWVALSFVRNPSDMQEIRDLINSHGHTTPVIAKIEKFEAIDQIDQILPLCDGVMVARGDLGVEMPAEEVPLLQKELIRKANSLGIPIITATQMLDSMASCPRPTRAEVSDVANAILDGTDAVMLSNETAVGDYPVEAVATMARIACRIERDYPSRPVDSHLASTIPNAISQAVSTIARQLRAAAILPLTKSGATARNVSKFRPCTTILAITSDVNVARQLQMVWGVNPLLIDNQESTSSTFTLAMGIAQEQGLLKEGDLVVQTAGTLSGVSGSTDLVKVGIVWAVLGRGLGIGHGSVSGRVRVATSPEAAARLVDGEILVVRETTADYLSAIRKAKAVIAEAAGSESHAAVIAQRLGVPVIVGVSNATTDLRHGEFVTMELREGLVHRGARSYNTASDRNGRI